MSKHRIAVIRGDGIGIEVVGEALKVLEAAGAKHGIEWTFDEFPWSSDYYRDHGQMMPDDGVEILRDYDAIFLGAVGAPDIQDHITLNGLLLPIRRTFDQFVCERPSILFPGVTSPLSGKKAYDVDMLVIRENTEGEYSGMGGFMYEGQPGEVAVQTAAFTRRGCERIIRYAFEAARKRNKMNHLTSITKSNALGYSMVLWDRTFEAVAEDYPDITTNSLLIDAACMDFIRKPESFDVVVASNLFGDILTDIGAVITGSMGLASSANFDPTRENPSMFEPTHGSAPDIAGQGLANPMAQILTGAMMVRHLGDEAAAAAIEASVKSVLEVGELLTPDLGGSASTGGVGDAIAGNL
ncbi:MAG: tartrate dehydrogenase [Dehalococcoidia bacterium]|jgi:tartrate dehydrogenase/decarboxylase/D-malate dehydrogenase|nr:tartrate dehydrogenase [Dehalococcoidia bacterium]